MKKLFCAIVCAVLPMTTLAAGAKVDLLPFEADLSDKESLQRGMELFVDNCLGCHSAKFQRYQRSAQDLGMDEDRVREAFLYGDTKIGEHMNIAMSTEDAAAWFGAPPPDLSLETRLRGPAWVYTYLQSFYVDEERPWGVNNKVFPDVGMPNVLESMQGVQRCKGEDCEEFELVKQGSMTPEDFDQAMYDLTNYMTYMGEPYRIDSERIGTYVLIFLAILFVFAYLLKKEFWKDVYNGSWRQRH